MGQKKEGTNLEQDKDISVLCPRCLQPAKWHKPAGFGQTAKFICQNPRCPSLAPNAGWGN